MLLVLAHAITFVFCGRSVVAFFKLVDYVGISYLLDDLQCDEERM